MKEQFVELQIDGYFFFIFIVQILWSRVIDVLGKHSVSFEELKSGKRGYVTFFMAIG
jgi:hypothetical protein